MPRQAVQHRLEVAVQAAAVACWIQEVSEEAGHLRQEGNSTPRGGKGQREAAAGSAPLGLSRLELYLRL